MADVLDADLAFDCPRCGRPAHERLYGPCRACRAELSARYGTEAGDGASDEQSASHFEPGMNVVPNHVATKD